MKKLVGLIAVAALFLSATVVLAGNPKSPADYNGLNKGNSDVNHLYLYEKDPANWTVVEDGAWGKLTYDMSDFTFNGHDLTPGSDYTLIRYLDPWPGSPVCLGTGIADDYGDVHIMGEWMAGGPKVWLVLSSDIDCGAPEMTGWSPSEYLFEYDQIGRTYVKFEVGINPYDSWWWKIGNVSYEWRSDGYFQFYPTSVISCAGSPVSSFNWTFNSASYNELSGDMGDLTDFLGNGQSYHVCLYNSF